MPVLLKQLANKKVIIFPSSLFTQYIPFSFYVSQRALAPPQQSGSLALLYTALGVEVGLTVFPGKLPRRMHKPNLIVI